MFQQYVAKYKEYLSSWAGVIAGTSSSITFDHTINTLEELSALRNASSAEHLVHLSNAYYDQVATGRAIKELYKKPKDYLIQHNNFIATQLKALDSVSIEVANQVKSIQTNILQSKSTNSISPELQKKLALIQSEYDARS